MAQTTYTIPLNDPPRVADACSAMFEHLVMWKQKYNLDFVSVVRVGANVEITFSDPVPLLERQHIRLASS